MPTANHQPAKLFRLPYGPEFYVCTCDAKTQDACTCDQDTLIATHRNPYLADPVLVDWLRSQSEPFSISQAIEAVGLADAPRVHAAIRVSKELLLCGCERIDSGVFKPASAETLTGLRLRQPARNQSPTEAHQETALPVIYLCGKQGIGKTAIANTLAQLLGCVKVIDGNSSDDEESQRVTPGTLVEGGYVEHICNRAPGSIAIDVQDDAAIENLITLLQRVANQVSASHQNQGLSERWSRDFEEMRRLTRDHEPLSPPLSASFLRSDPAIRSARTEETAPAPQQADAAVPDPLL